MYISLLVSISNLKTLHYAPEKAKKNQFVLSVRGCLFTVGNYALNFIHPPTRNGEDLSEIIKPLKCTKITSKFLIYVQGEVPVSYV